MSHGGRERKKSHESSTDPPREPGTASFSQAVVRVGVGQICGNEGFQGFQRSALEALSDVAIRYVLDIGKKAVSAANSAGRTEPNAFDVVHGVEDLRSVVGFSGAADVDGCLLSSGAAREILRYVYGSEETPFAYPLPSFPVSKDWRQSPSFTPSGEEPPDGHIPAWLPKYPDPQAVEEKRSRAIDKSALNLPNGVTCNGLGPSKETKEERNSRINPFLVEPIQSGEEEVPPVVLPSEVDHRSMKEFAGNQIEDQSNDSNRGGNSALLKQRQAVQFKIQRRKKTLQAPLELSLREEGGHDNGFGGENKRSTGKAPKESSIESPKDQAVLQ